MIVYMYICMHIGSLLFIFSTMQVYMCLDCVQTCIVYFIYLC